MEKHFFRYAEIGEITPRTGIFEAYGIKYRLCGFGVGGVYGFVII